MFSADLSRLEVGGLRRRLKEEQPKIARTLQRIERNLGNVAKRCREDDKGNWVSPRFT